MALVIRVNLFLLRPILFSFTGLNRVGSVPAMTHYGIFAWGIWQDGQDNAFFFTPRTSHVDELLFKADVT